MISGKPEEDINPRFLKGGAAKTRGSIVPELEAKLAAAEDTLAIYREAFHAIEVECAREIRARKESAEPQVSTLWVVRDIAHNALLGQATVRK